MSLRVACTAAAGMQQPPGSTVGCFGLLSREPARQHSIDHCCSMTRMQTHTYAWWYQTMGQPEVCSGGCRQHAQGSSPDWGCWRCCAPEATGVPHTQPGTGCGVWCGKPWPIQQAPQTGGRVAGGVAGAAGGEEHLALRSRLACGPCCCSRAGTGESDRSREPADPLMALVGQHFTARAG